MSLLIAPTRERHYDVFRTEIDMRLTPKLISEYTSNSNFLANREDNENDQDNKNHRDNENEGNYRTNKHVFKVNNRKRSGVFMISFEPISHLALVFSMSNFHDVIKCVSTKQEIHFTE